MVIAWMVTGYRGGEGEGAGGSGDGNWTLVLFTKRTEVLGRVRDKMHVRFWRLLCLPFCGHSEGRRSDQRAHERQGLGASRQDEDYHCRRCLHFIQGYVGDEKLE